MRMWMVDPQILCKNHLLGEHGEIHKFRHNFVKQHNMAGRIGQIDPTLMQDRHDDLVMEMHIRGYNHNSPYTQPDVSYLPEMKINLKEALADLISRCPECKRRYYELMPIEAIKRSGGAALPKVLRSTWTKLYSRLG